MKYDHDPNVTAPGLSAGSRNSRSRDLPESTRFASGRINEPHELPPGPLHVFGYGSLLWRPGFDYIERETARLHGFHRALRVWSWHHRGSPERPGLVLGLDHGGCCDGCVFHVPENEKLDVARYLWDREMVTSVYVPRLIRVRTGPRTVLSALTFTLDRDHEQYAGALSPAEAVPHVLNATGKSGANPDYILGTLAGLESVGIRDRYLSRVADLLLRHDSPSRA